MKINTIIFDMDGTLYKFKNGSFRGSGVYREMITNTIDYISEQLNISRAESERQLGIIRKKYLDEISTGLVKELSMERYAYFNFAWNIDPNKYVGYDSEVIEIIKILSEKYQLIILTDAPKVWALNVLDHIGIREYFTNIYTGEEEVRKSTGGAHQRLIDLLRIDPRMCIFVGDEAENDLEPAKDLGMETILISEEKLISCKHNQIKDLKEILQVIDRLES